MVCFTFGYETCTEYKPIGSTFLYKIKEILILFVEYWDMQFVLFWPTFDYVLHFILSGRLILNITEVHSEPCQISKLEFFVKTVNDWKLLT